MNIQIQKLWDMNDLDRAKNVQYYKKNWHNIEKM